MTMTCVLTFEGAKFLAKLARGDSDASPILYVGIGDGTDNLSPYDVTMGNEIASRVSSTVTYTTSRVRLTAQFTGLTEGDDYSEFGVFDLAAGGILYSRHSPYALVPGESLTTTTRQVPSDGIVNAIIDYYIVQGTY